MHKIVSALGLLFLVGCSTTGSFEKPSNDLVIRGDTGGVVSTYKTKALMAKESNHRVVIDGECSSSCLFYLSSYSSGRYCATERAKLGFHSIYFIDSVGNIIRTNPEELKEKSHKSTTEFLEVLHPELRNRYKSSGYPSVYSGASPTDLAIISGQEAINILGKC